VNEYRKPLPRPNRLSAPYWQGAKQHELRLQRCSDCGAWRFPPSERCADCLSKAVEWTAASGRGRIWSWISMHQRYYPAFEAELPYVVAYVQLEEGPKLMSNLIGVSEDEIACDLPVEVVFDDVTPEYTLPKFRPAPRT
jgi:uncharacterized OB-fold protein